MKAIVLATSLFLAAAGLYAASQWFTFNFLPNVPTTLSGVSTNSLTNATVDVSNMDTLSLQLSAVISNPGNSTITFAFKRGQVYENVNTQMDSAAFLTWTVSAAAWTGGSTNIVSTNLVNVRDFQLLQLATIINGNTSVVANTALYYGSALPYGSQGHQ